MAVYKQFNTNEVVVSPFKANKRFRFENNQVSSSDVCIEYYQSQQGTYLSGSYDTGFNTMQDGVTVFSSIKQLYYSNYLTASYGDPMSTMSFVPGPTDPQGNSLGQDAWNGNITGPRFDNFLQSSLTQDRKFAQFSASAAPVGFAGTNTEVSQSVTTTFASVINANNITFQVVPDLAAKGINETYVLSNVTWGGVLADTPFKEVGTSNNLQSCPGNQLQYEWVSTATATQGLTLKGSATQVEFSNVNTPTVGTTLTLDFVLAPKGPSIISIPSMLFGEAIQPSSFQFEYTSSINFTRSIVDDDGQGNLIVTQSNSAGVPFFSGSVGEIFYSQGIAVITGPDSGNLREFAHNVGYKDNMNPNIMSSSLSYSSSITIDENQYKCTVRNDEFSYTTNPSALGTSGALTATNNQLFKSFDAGDLTGLVDNTYIIEPLVLKGNTAATTFFIFDGDEANENTIGQSYRVELQSAGGKTLEFVGWNGAETGTRNGLGQVQFNSTGSTAGIAQSFCDAVNSVEGFNGEISASIQGTSVTPSDPNNTVKLTQAQKGEAGNTPIRYADSFNLILNQSVLPIPSRGQVSFGNTDQPATNPQPVSGDSSYTGINGAILEIVVATNAVTSINVSSSISSNAIVASSKSFGGKNYSVGDALQIKGTDLGGTGLGYINLTSADVEKDKNTQIYHDFVTGSEFSPYVTTIGLYNGSNELVVVGKLPRPLPISLQTDTTYMINFDTN
jgi:hypothetical protein